MTSPCSALTALTEVRGAQGERGHVEHRALARCRAAAERRGKSSRCSPRRPQQAGEVRLDQLERKRVVAGGTGGVWVVNTVDLRTSASAAVEGVSAAPRNSRMRCSTTNPACPSLRCQTIGLMPSARSARTPADAEDDLLLDARFAVAAVERARAGSRSHGAFSARSVSSRAPGDASRTRHTGGQHGARRRAGRRCTHGLASVGRQGRLDRRVRSKSSLRVALLLPAVGRQVRWWK